MTNLAFTLAGAPTQAEAAAASRLFCQPTEFLKGVVAMSGMPPADRPEVCFAGRSNVGKSSLINALTGRRALARTSNTPGRTQQINFFTLGPGHYLVDVPGYGFARAPVAVVSRWQNLLQAYLCGRASLRRVFLLIDARHGPKPADKEVMMLLTRAAVTFQAVMTKCDKPKAGVLTHTTEKTIGLLRKHAAAYPEIVQTSSTRGDGIGILRGIIAGLA
ncbi:MAG: YihA family ribosome biogenesis GTP-binding protein [Rhodobacteraceae bacterium]|nr:YihA family ribosome biogenesis GTP-binding protein [Paracoccaceae bacterium]